MLSYGNGERVGIDVEFNFTSKSMLNSAPLVHALGQGVQHRDVDGEPDDAADPDEEVDGQPAELQEICLTDSAVCIAPSPKSPSDPSRSCLNWGLCVVVSSPHSHTARVYTM